MAEQLSVEIRETRGKHKTRRLRKAGRVPAVLYGHGEQNVALSVPADQLDALIHHGNRLVTLSGAVDQSVLIREVQWDTWGSRVLHVDFARVSADERVQIQLSVELRGEAPGVREGGVVEQLAHQLTIECPAGAMPEKISVGINELKLHESITAGQLGLPPQARLLGSADEVVVQCVEPAAAPEEVEAAEAGPGEPEVIGAKADEPDQEAKKS